MSTDCQVCGAEHVGQYHFGAITCRACAAFFRRYVNTKKSTILCNCFAKRESQYPCRLCRMKKCKAVGMQEMQVQGPRDSSKALRKRKMMLDSSFSSPEAPRIKIGIKLRNLDRLVHSAKSYESLEITRKAVFDSKENVVNMYEFSLEVKTDSKLLWKLCEMCFTEFDGLTRSDKKTLFFNFYTKWTIMEACISSARNNNQMKFFSPSGAEAIPLERFYSDCIEKKSELSEQDVQRIFEPYWKYQLENVMAPVCKMGLGQMENMALFGIMLWDPSYTNVSEHLAEMCHAMRKIIFRELSSYFEEEGNESSRFFETLDTINLIEKAEHKCQEEMQLCGMYDIAVDGDMRDMIMWDKY